MEKYPSWQLAGGLSYDKPSLEGGRRETGQLKGEYRALLLPYFWSSGRRSDPPLDCNQLNLAIRQHVAPLGRRVTTMCKGEEDVRQQLALFQVYHNVVLPHASLRQILLAPEPTNGSGSAKQWRPCTPAMAAGLTDQVWTLREVLLFRVPPPQVL